MSGVYRWAERLVRNAANLRWQARRSSDAGPQAKSSLRGGLASVDGHRSKAINHRSPAVGNGIASARRRPMDLPKIHGHRCGRIPWVDARLIRECGKGRFAAVVSLGGEHESCRTRRSQRPHCNSIGRSRTKSCSKRLTGDQLRQRWPLHDSCRNTAGREPSQGPAGN